jgi:hypothetical protein
MLQATAFALEIAFLLRRADAGDAASPPSPTTGEPGVDLLQARETRAVRQAPAGGRDGGETGGAPWR